jgi:hypothetical protein
MNYGSTTFLSNGTLFFGDPDDAELEAVKRLVPKGQVNARHARLILADLGWENTQSNHRHFRRIVKTLRDNGTPITATIRGYFRANDITEFEIGEWNKMKNALSLLDEARLAKRRTYSFEK